MTEQGTAPSTIPSEHHSPHWEGEGVASAIDEAAARLRQAAQTKRPCPPVRGLLPDGSIGAAYAVQQINIERELDTVPLYNLAYKDPAADPSTKTEARIELFQRLTLPPG